MFSSSFVTISLLNWVLLFYYFIFKLGTCIGSLVNKHFVGKHGTMFSLLTNTAVKKCS